MLKIDELVAELVTTSGINKVGIRGLLSDLTNLIVRELNAGESISIPGLGIFKVKPTAERTGRNPQTGEALTIKAGKKVSLKVSSSLKNLIK